MRKIFLLVFVLLTSLLSKGQANSQTMGNDSTVVTIKAIAKGNKGLIPGIFTDTAAANAWGRVKTFQGLIIFTTSDNKTWIRNTAANAWLELASSAGTVTALTNGLTLSGSTGKWGGTLVENTTVSGANTYNTAFDAVSAFRAEANTGTGKISSALVGTDSIFFQPNEGNFIIDSLNSGASTDSVLVWTQATGRVKKRAYSAFTPTWQQTLTAGSTLTTDNTALLNGNNFSFSAATSRLDSLRLIGANLYIQNGIATQELNDSYSGAGSGTYTHSNDGRVTTIRHYGAYTSGCTTCGLNTMETRWLQNAAYPSGTDTLLNAMGAHNGPNDKHFYLADLTDDYSAPGIPANRYVTIEKNGTPFFGAYNNPANNNAQILVGFYPYWATSGYEAYRFVVGGRSIFNGRVNFLDSIYATGLTNLSTQDRLIGQYSSDGRFGYTTLGSGLSLSSGVLNTSGTVATPISSLTAATGTNSIDNTNFGQSWSWNTLTSGVGLQLFSNTTAAASSTQELVRIDLSGTNSNSGETTIGLRLRNRHAGTTSTNIGLQVDAVNGTSNNYAIIVPASGGSVGIGTSTPTSLLHVNGATKIEGTLGVYREAANAIDFYNAAGSQNIGYIKRGDDASLVVSAALVGLTLESGGSATSGITMQAVAAAPIIFKTTNTERIRILSSGGVGIGTSSPTARVHIAAGTATASTAPLKFTSGTLLTTAEAGAIEFLTDAYYGTITTGAARKTFAFLESPIFTGLVSLPHLKGTSSTPSIAGGAGAGTSPTVSITGTDLAGEITVTTDADPAAGAVFCTVTFATAFSSAPYVVFSPSNDNAAKDIRDIGVVMFVNSTTTTFTLNVSSLSAPNVTTEYKFMYHVIQ